MLVVFKNGPRMWILRLDSVPRRAGHYNLRRLTADALVHHGVDLPKDIEVGKKGSTYYKPTISHISSVMGFVAGKPVFILDDPDGYPWVMQASAQIVDPNLTYDQLANLGGKLKLPPGWNFRVTVLDRDLNIKAINGDAGSCKTTWKTPMTSALRRMARRPALSSRSASATHCSQGSE